MTVAGRKAWLVKERIYRLPKGQDGFGLYWGINYLRADGKPHVFVQECMINPVECGENDNLILSEN